MMRRHAWIGLVAILGVLLHAAAVVRHHAVTSGPPSAEQALLADVANAICHGTLGAAELQRADLPDVPVQHRNADCPICLGMAVAFLPAAPQDIALPLAAAGRALWPSSDQVIRKLARLHPFARGPPVAV
jgi:hypothetical protein